MKGKLAFSFKKSNEKPQGKEKKSRKNDEFFLSRQVHRLFLLFEKLKK
jgi:hypothetical protein